METNKTLLLAALLGFSAAISDASPPPELEMNCPICRGVSCRPTAASL